MTSRELQGLDHVRGQVVAEHDALRELLAQVEEEAQRFENGGEAEGRALRSSGFALLKALSAHLESEERMLIGPLRARDDGRLVERLEREHREQRELLTFLLSRLGESTLPTTLVAQELKSFIGYVKQDMAYEESVLLAELASDG